MFWTNCWQGHGIWGMGPWNAVPGIVFWILLVTGLVYLVRWIRHNERSGRETPLEILRRRFAAGEINSEEYSFRKKELQN